MGLSGSLRTISLAEIVQTLGRSGATGALTLTAPQGTRHVVFHEGNVVRVVHDGTGATSLVERLIALGAISVDNAADIGGSGGYDSVMPLSQDPQVNHDDLQGALEQVLMDDLLDVFTWEGANFSFREASDPNDPEAMSMVAAAIQGRLAVPVSVILMESARRLDEWNAIRDELPDGHTVPRIYDDRQTDLFTRAKPYPDSLVIDAINGIRSIDQIIEVAPVSLIDAYSVLHKAMVEGSIGLLRLPDMVNAGRHMIGTNSPSQAATILRHALAEDPTSGEALGLLAQALDLTGAGAEAAQCYAQVAHGSLAQGLGEQAVAAARRAVELDPQPEFQLTVVMTLIETDQPDAAAAQLMQLANQLSDQRQWADARSTCLKVLQLQPDHQEARRLLAKIYTDSGDASSDHVTVCVACGESNPRDRETCQACSAPLHLTCLSCNRVVSVSDRLCIFCGANPHVPPSGDKPVRRGPHTSAIIRRDRLNSGANVAQGDAEADPAAVLRDQIEQARFLEESGDYNGAIEIWREMARSQGGQELGHHIRELEAHIHDMEMESLIEQANALRRGRRFSAAAKNYLKAIRAMSERDPRRERLEALHRSCLRGNRMASMVYFATFLVLLGVAYLVAEPLLRRQRIAEAVEGLILQASVVDRTVNEAHWADLRQQRDDLLANSGQLGITVGARLKDFQTALIAAGQRIRTSLLQEARTAIESDNDDVAEDLLVRISKLVPELVGANEAELKNQIDRIRDERAERAAAIAAAPQALQAALELISAKQLDQALAAMNDLHDAADPAVAERARSESERLTSEKAEVEAAITAALALPDQDLVAGREALSAILPRAEFWSLDEPVRHAVTTTIAALEAAEQAFAALQADFDGPAGELFLTQHAAAPQVDAVRRLLADWQEREARRADAIAAYQAAVTSQQHQRAWRLGRSLAANYPDLAESITVPVIIQVGQPSAQAQFGGARVADADEQGVITWYRPLNAGPITIAASGSDPVTIPAAAVEQDWQHSVALERSIAWQNQLGFEPLAGSSGPHGLLVEGLHATALIASDGRVLWQIDRGQVGIDQATRSSARPRLMADGSYLIPKHDGSVVSVALTGDISPVASVDQVLQGQPAVYTSELIGNDPRVAIVTDRLLVGNPAASLEPMATGQGVIQGTAVYDDGLDVLLIVGLIDGTLVGLDGATGEVNWRVLLSAADIGPLAWLDDSTLVCVLDGSRLVWITVSTQAANLAREVDLNRGLVGEPIIQSGELEVTNGATYVRYAADGSVQQQQDLPGLPTAAVTHAGPSLVVATTVSNQPVIMSLDEDGERWRRGLPRPASLVAVTDGRAMVVLDDGTILAFEP